jgi:phage terminase small subunit
MTDKQSLQPQPTLTPKQSLFIDHYIETLNGTESYLKAFDAHNRVTAATEGSKLLRNPQIKAEVDRRLEALRSPLIASAQQVLTFLTDMMGKEDAKDTDRIRAAELLGKRYALFTDKIDLNQSVEVEINLVPLDSPQHDSDTIDIEFEEVD